MAWLELKLSCNEQQTAAWEHALEECGALAITYTDQGDQLILEPPLGETPLWQNTALTALFEEDTDSHDIISRLSKQLGLDMPAFSWSLLEDQIWEREWLQHHQPLCIANRFWVFHEVVKNGDNLPTLLLDPGLAFGTGTHPTTALCLEWLGHQNLDQKTILDYGCGSGILGIAAQLLGANTLLFTDIDQQALIATKNNCQRNNIVPENISIFLPEHLPQQLQPLPVDLICANILAGPLCELAESLSGLVKAGGEICLSGLLENQRQAIEQAYSPWFDGFTHHLKEGWIQISAVRIR